MINPELLRSWACTKGYLRDARSNVSKYLEAEYSNDFVQFDEFIEHNELGLAFDTLCSVAKESRQESVHVFELLALSAASMGRLEDQRELDCLISELTEATHETHLPRLDA
ncbi:hypothetical protein [Ideonella sp. YS5]|uniref:hypothetical protein n=1 Tax=Ideonella sp. YS5 TaxID=3453714 RepID=UPI003EEADCCA